MPTSKDVAILAGVSPATVSRVFRGETIVAETTRKKVMEAARQLNYTPSHAASILKKNNNRTVAFLDPDPQNPFYIQMISKIGEILEKDYDMAVLMAPNTNYNKRLLTTIRTFLSYRVECIVFSPILGTDDKTIPRLNELFEAEQNCKFLQLHSLQYPQVDAIYYNDVVGMEMVTTYLLERGHRRILIVSDDCKRIVGCNDAYRKAGIDTPEIPVEPLNFAMSTDQLAEYIHELHPTAIISVAEMFSLKTYSALTKLKYRIPDDISLIVFDDTAWTRAMDITVVTHSEEEVIQSAVEAITSMIDGQHTQVEHKIVLPMLVERSSVKTLTS